MINKDKIIVGQFGPPVGLQGEIKVNIMTTTFETFKNLKHYTNSDGSIVWEFKKINIKGNKCVASLNEYLTIEDVSKLKGQKIYSHKDNLPNTKINEYYVDDLIGCKIIITNNKTTGEIANVRNFGAGDLFEVNINNKIILIPFNKENIISVNIHKKEIIADPIKGILD